MCVQCTSMECANISLIAREYVYFNQYVRYPVVGVVHAKYVQILCKYVYPTLLNCNYMHN